MFGPTKTAAYAIQALAYLAERPEGVRGAERLSRRSGVPRAYLVKILHALARRGLVSTKRGYRGGYRLARSADEISAFDVVVAVDGPDVFQRCLLGLGKCSSKRACPLHPVWSKQRVRIEERCRRLTLRELASFDGRETERDFRFGLPG